MARLAPRSSTPRRLRFTGLVALTLALGILFPASAMASNGAPAGAAPSGNSWSGVRWGQTSGSGASAQGNSWSAIRWGAEGNGNSWSAVRWATSGTTDSAAFKTSTSPDGVSWGKKVPGGRRWR